VTTVGAWGREGGYFANEEEADTFEDELKALLVNQYVAFNSRTQPAAPHVGSGWQWQCWAVSRYSAWG